MTVKTAITIKYKWVPRDALNAKKRAPVPPPTDAVGKWADYQDRKISPYGFVHETLLESEKRVAGEMVSISLAASVLFPLEVRRFAAFPPDADWLDLPKEAESVATIGELCLKLYTLGTTTMKEKYGGIYDDFKDYDPSVEPTATTKLARQNLGRAIFDFWDNTKYRYAVITTTGAFDWTPAFDKPWELPIQASSDGANERILKAPAHVKLVKEVPASRGTQQVTVPPADAARIVLAYIKDEAQKRAKVPKTVDKGSKFYQRLTSYYLVDYLPNPSIIAGAAAIKKIGEAFGDQPGDWWEEQALKTWNRQPLPQGLRAVRPNLPETISAATDILSLRNRAYLPYIDVDALVGSANTEVGEDQDVTGGGKNVSQLMHWATGAKYNKYGSLPMRELFFAYEMWHLEAWDVFGEDPINDMIAEDAGRSLGEALAAGALTSENLSSGLDREFASARAWVGSLIRARQHPVVAGPKSGSGGPVLDEWALLDVQRPTNFHWDKANQKKVWGPDTIKSLLVKGKTVDEVEKDALTERIIGIYTLMYEADEWEKANGTIPTTELIQNLLAGKFDDLLTKLSNNQKDISTDDLRDAKKNAGP